MKNILLFILLSVSFKVFCQDIKNLDSRYGFNKFKLEDPFEKLQSSCKYSETIDNLGYYRYTNRDIDNVFSLPINEIYLIFYKSKLYKIKINFAFTTDANEDYVLNKLRALYGNYQKTYAKSELLEFLYKWIGEKAQLFYSKLWNISKTQTTTSIEITSIKLVTEKQNDEF